MTKYLQKVALALTGVLPASFVFGVSVPSILPTSHSEVSASCVSPQNTDDEKMLYVSCGGFF